MRTTSGFVSRGGMKSINRTVPSADLELGLQDERVVSIAPGGGLELGCGLERPVSVLLRPEERSEARPGIEARQAEPVHGSVAADERGRLEVSDETVVLDAGGHCSPRSAA